jgi:uncharacterized protein YjeT (DUF2065 family)
MRIVLVMLGGYMAIAGVLLLLHPTFGKQCVDVLLKDKVSRRWAVVTVLLGVLIWWAAPASGVSRFIQVLGGITVVKGLYLIIAPREQLRRVIDWWYGLPRTAVRYWGVVAIVPGGAILLTL